MLNILCFSWVEEDTSTQKGGTERFRFWSQLRKLSFHPWPGAKQIYNLQAVNNFNGCCIWLFYNKIGAVAQCPNNWGVASVFPTLENTYLLVKYCWSLNQMPLEIDKLLDLIKVDENKKPLKSPQYLSLSQANIKTICSSGSIPNIY